MNGVEACVRKSLVTMFLVASWEFCPVPFQRVSKVHEKNKEDRETSFSFSFFIISKH